MMLFLCAWIAASFLCALFFGAFVRVGSEHREEMARRKGERAASMLGFAPSIRPRTGELGKEARMSDLEAAITRLEHAATIWFNQDLHRDLQTLIAAAREKADSSRRRSFNQALNDAVESLERDPAHRIPNS
jgi:hypothetical protein